MCCFQVHKIVNETINVCLLVCVVIITVAGSGRWHVLHTKGIRFDVGCPCEYQVLNYCSISFLKSSLTYVKYAWTFGLAASDITDSNVTTTWTYLSRVSRVVDATHALGNPQFLLVQSETICQDMSGWEVCTTKAIANSSSGKTHMEVSTHCFERWQIESRYRKLWSSVRKSLGGL